MLRRSQDIRRNAYPQLIAATGNASRHLTIQLPAVVFRVLQTQGLVLAFKQFTSFLMSRKRYWLLPLAIFVGILAALIFLGQRRAALAPFVYSRAIAPPIVYSTSTG